MFATLVAAIVTACGGPSTTAPATAPLTAPPSASATAFPASAAPSVAPTVAPDDLRSLAGEHPDVPPGTWRWTAFEPAIQLTVESGWAIGHAHDNYVDLFRGDSFPAIGFGRFPRVVGGSGALAATDAATVVATMRSNPDLVVDELGTASLAGLSGLTIDLHALKAQTPVLRADDGDFNFDPGFAARYHLLDVEGGVLLVAVVTMDGELEAAQAQVEPVLESLQVVGEPAG